MRASELLLIVRAQNQASGALRRVAGDLRGLSAVSGLRQRGQALQIARQQLMTSRQNAMNELSSIENGKRALTLKKAAAAAEISTLQTNLRRSGVERNILANDAAKLRNLAQQSRLTRQMAVPQISGIRRGELAKQLEAAKIAARSFAIEEQRLGSKMQVANAAIEKQQIALRELSAREADAARRAAMLRSQIASYGDRLRLNTQKIDDNNRAINRARWDKVGAGGRIFQHFSRVMEYAGLVLGGTLAATANMAAKFETSVTLAATQTRKAGQSFLGTAANSKILQRDIRSLMTEFPAQADDFSKAAYDIYSSTDVSFRGGRRALKLFAQAAVAGQTDVATATNAGIVVLNNFGNNVNTLPKRLQRMFAAVRFGRMTFADFATSMSTIGPAARAANQSFDEMAGTFAFLTRHLDVAKARVGFARVLEVLSTPKMLTGLKKAGVAIQDVNHHLFPLHTIIGNILERFPKLRRGGTDAMNFFKNIGGLQGTIQARRAFTFLVQFFDRAGKDGASYLSMLNKVKTDNNEFTQSLAAMEKTTGVRWGVFVNQLKALALAFGADVIPAILQLAGPIQDLVHWWENLDDATRRTVARFATYTAVFMLVGGAVAFLSGTLVRLFAFFGKFLGFGAGLSATFITLGLAAAALTGNIRALSDILNVVANFTFGSWQGFAISLGIAASMAVRLTGAMRGLAAAEGAVAGGGILASMLGRGRGAARGFGVGREIGGFRTAILGAATGAGLLSTSMLTVGGVIAAGIGGLYLWKRHMDNVKRDAEALRQATAIGAAPRRQADVFQGLVGSVENIERTKISIRDIQRTIAGLRQQLSGARGADRAALLDQIRVQTMDLADAQNSLSLAYSKSNRQFDAYTAAFAAFVPAANKIRELQNRLRELRSIGVDSAQAFGRDIPSEIRKTEAQLRSLMSETRTSAAGMRTAFNSVVIGLSKIGQIPRPTRAALQDMFNVSKRLGRMLTIPEMKAVIKAEIDPAARRNLPGQLKRIFAGIRAQRIKVEIHQQEVQKATQSLKKAQQVIPKALRFPKFTFPDPSRSAREARNKAAKVLTPIHQKVVVDRPNVAGMGASIAAGIQAELNANPVTLTVLKKVMVKEIEAGSPSRWAARALGKPISQGIALGILQAAGEIEKAAMITMDLFQGAILTKLDEKKKPTGALLIKDLQSQLQGYRQFNQALARLARRGAPKELIDQLAALGPEAASKIALLSKMSAPELRKYIQLWRQAQVQVKRSLRATQEDIRAAAKQLRTSIRDNLISTFNSIRDTNVSNFGAIFQGPTNLASMTGDNFKQAMADYQSAANDFRDQISDLNNQIADAHREAQQRLVDAIQQRRDELQNAMGQIFGGDWLSGVQVQTRLEWGKKLGFDDLQKDLQTQVDKFRRWRELLVSIAARVPPDLAQQLESLGPEAVDKLEVLNSGSADQLAQYVTLWQQGQQAINAVASKTTVDTSDITARVNDILGQIAEVTRKLGALQMPHELTAQDIINDLKAQQDQWIEYGGILQNLADRGIPAELLQQLQQLGPEALPYLRALNSMTDDQLKDLGTVFKKNQELITTDTIKMLNTQLYLWFQYGQRIGINIAQGVIATSPQLNAFFTDLIEQLLLQHGYKTPPQIALPPSGGGPPYPVGGTTGGITSVSGFQAATDAGVSTSQNTYYNLTVNQADGEDLSSTLEKATFRLENRRVE